MYITARGIRVDRLDKERPNRLAKFIFSEYKKKTKIHFSILFINIISILLSLTSETIDHLDEKTDFITAFYFFGSLISNNLIGVVILSVLTAFFMLLAYRAVQIEPIRSNIDGNRNLTAEEIDKEYINFSRSDCIDGHSTLLLIAGDLSFLGDIPDITKLDKKVRERCYGILSENSLKNSCCHIKKCPVNGKCIERKAQFEQFFDLKNKEITLRIICQKPKSNSDIPYKRRLGRLKQIFSDNIEIRFLPKDTLGSGICVLGRIKENGGIQELFWHWKNPKKPGTYTVPNTKKADTSENKTLIYLLGTTLWNSAAEMDAKMIEECVNAYNKAIGKSS